MIFKQVPVGTFQNFAYIIGDEKTKLCAIVDPAWEVDKLLDQCKELNLTVSFVINTHSHHDHVEGNDAAVKRSGAKIIAHEKSPLRKDIQVKGASVGHGAGSALPSGGQATPISVLRTPGRRMSFASSVIAGIAAANAKLGPG